MTVQIDSSSPAVVKNATTGNNVTASFTPPAGATIVVVCTSNGTVSTTQTYTITDSVAGAITTRVIQHDNSSTPNGEPGSAAIATLHNVTNAARTITGSRSDNVTGWMMKVYVITGAEASFTGATARGSGASGAPTVNLTATEAGSLVLWGASDWSALAAGTAGTGNTILEDQVVGSQYTGHIGQRTALTTAAGAVTCNMTLPNAQDYDVVAAEIRPSRLTFTAGTPLLAHNDTLAVPIPAGVVNGDLLLMFVAAASNFSSISLSATGWTVAFQQTGVPAGGAENAFALLYRQADGTESGTITVSSAVVDDFTIAIVNVHDPLGRTLPIPTWVLGDDNTGTAVHATPSATPPADDGAVLGFFACDQSGTAQSWTTSATGSSGNAVTELVDAFETTNQTTLWVAVEKQLTATATQLTGTYTGNGTAARTPYGAAVMVTPVATAAATGAFVRLRARYASGSGSLVAELREGGALRATLSTGALTASFATYSYELTTAELASISDPTALELWLTATSNVDASWTDVELPSAGGAATGNAGVVAVAATVLAPTGGAEGTTQTQPHTVVVGLAAGAGGASATAGVVAATVTTPTATAGAGGTTQTQPHAATIPTPTAGAEGTTVAPVARQAFVPVPNAGTGGTTTTLPLSAFVPVPTGGAGGTTTALPVVTVTVPQAVGSSPDATGQAGVVVATATTLQPTGGAGGTTQIGPAGLVLDGATNTCANTPDLATWNVSGVLDVVVRATANWHPAAIAYLVSHTEPTSSDRSWALLVNATVSSLRFQASSNGTTYAVDQNSSAAGLTDGVEYWLGCSFNAATGALAFYKANGYQAMPTLWSGWTLISSHSVTATTFFDPSSTTTLALGASSGFTSSRFAGTIYRAAVYDDGALIANPDFSNTASPLALPGATSYTDSTGKVWTLRGTALVPGQNVGLVNVRPPTAGAGGTTVAPVARQVTFPTPTGGAEGTTNTLPINVVVGIASGGGGASATAGVVVASVITPVPTGGAGGTTQTLPVTTALLTPLGGAGGTTNTLPINVTVLQPSVAGDATGNAGVVVASATVLTPTGGAGGTTQTQPHTVTVLQPTVSADATGQAGVVVATAAIPTATAGAGGTTTTLPINVTVLGLPSAGGGAAGVVPITATVLTPTGSASGTAGVVAAAVVVRTPTAGAAGTTTPLQASVAVQSPSGGAGGTTVAQPHAVTVLPPTAVGQSVGQAGIVAAQVVVRQPTGGAGGTAQPVVVTVTVLEVYLFTGTFPGGVLVGVGAGPGATTDGDEHAPGVSTGTRGAGAAVVGTRGAGARTEPRFAGGVTVGSS